MKASVRLRSRDPASGPHIVQSAIPRVAPGAFTARSLPLLLSSPSPASTRSVAAAAQGMMPGGKKGGSSGGGGKGGGARGSRGGAGGRGNDKKAPPKPSFLTPPIEHRLSYILTPWERLPRPLWSTFCGASTGTWKGSYVALSPVDGDPEPLVLDGKEKIRMLKTVVTERRLMDPDLGDILMRSEKRLSPAASPDSEPVAEFSEVFRQSDLGLVSFEDGSYSSGPMRLGVPVALEELGLTVARNPLTRRTDEEEDEDEPEGAFYLASEDERISGEGKEEEEEEEEEEDGLEDIIDGLSTGERPEGAAGEEEEEEEEEDDPIYLEGEDPDDPRETAVIEQCVSLGGKMRVRIELTLSARGGGAVELDVIVLRLTAHYEEWTDPTPAPSAPAPPTVSNMNEPMTARELESGVMRAIRLRNDAEYKLLPVLRPKDVQGTWRVFSIVASPVEELGPEGVTTTQFAMASIETEEKWVPRGSTPEELGEDGASMWLPGKVIVGISMNPEKDAAGRPLKPTVNANGAPTEVPREFFVSLGWMYEDGRMTAIEREYNSSGALKEVRMKSGVFGKWAGGRG